MLSYNEHFFMHQSARFTRYRDTSSFLTERIHRGIDLIKFEFQSSLPISCDILHDILQWSYLLTVIWKGNQKEFAWKKRKHKKVRIRFAVSFLFFFQVNLFWSPFLFTDNKYNQLFAPCLVKTSTP